MPAAYRYVECRAEDIPAAVSFTVPRRNGGQMIEVAYGGFGRAEHDAGDPFKRVENRAAGPGYRYYRLVDANGKLATGFVHGVAE